MPWQIEINSDNTVVFLNLTRLDSQDNLNGAKIISALQDKNIPLPPETENRIHEILAQLSGTDRREDRPVLIRAAGAIDGENGRFEWSQKCNPEKIEVLHEEPEPSHSANFYQRSRLIIINKGDQIGVLHPPTAGKPGQDVFGQPITPQPGTDFKVEPGKNVQLIPDGRTFVAQCDGEPKLENGTLNIDPTLTVRSDVDFATGNVAFSGDVNIKGDIKDLFEVRTGGNLLVEGMVEAAQIECAGSLNVKRGISGKEKGSIRVHKDLSAKYLSNVTVWVQGDTIIDSEIVNTDLNCSGKILLQRGAIHGGRVCAAGNIETPVIGSPAGVRTIVRAAVDPFLERRIKELNLARAEFSDRINTLMPKAKAMLAAYPGRPNPDLKKMADEIKKSKQQIEQLELKRTQLQQEMSQKCNGTIIVHKMIYPGVILYVADIMQAVEREMSGPLQVMINRAEGQFQTLTFRAPAETTVK